MVILAWGIANMLAWSGTPLDDKDCQVSLHFTSLLAKLHLYRNETAERNAAYLAGWFRSADGKP